MVFIVFLNLDIFTQTASLILHLGCLLVSVVERMSVLLLFFLHLVTCEPPIGLLFAGYYWILDIIGCYWILLDVIGGHLVTCEPPIGLLVAGYFF